MAETAVGKIEVRWQEGIPDGEGSSALDQGTTGRGETFFFKAPPLPHPRNFPLGETLAQESSPCTPDGSHTNLGEGGRCTLGV